MKALVKKKSEVGIWLEEVPHPQLEPEEILLKVRRAAICGTDVHIYEWDEWAQGAIPLPVTLGHEFVGEIVELGSAVRGFRVGQRVCSEGHIYCNLCRNCRTDKRHLCLSTHEGIGLQRNGGFAEYVAIPAANAVAIPDSISDDIAAIFDPFGNAIHAALSFELIAEDVLITGAGPIGMMAASICRHAGARNIVITDLNETRLALAKRMGATHTVNIGKESLAEVMEREGLRDFTVGLEMSGAAAAFDQMTEVMAPGGGISLLGILPKGAPVDWPRVIFKGLHLKGIYGREMFKTWFYAIRLVEGGLDLSPMITHRFPFEQYEEAFATMRAGSCGKVVLNME